MSVFSEKLSELMKTFDMSDEQLANLTSVNRTTVTRWRTGERSPKMEKLPEISKVFNVKPQIFVGEITNDKNDILPIYNQLNDNRKEKVFSYAEKQLEEQQSNNSKVVPIVGKTAANPNILEYGDIDIENQSFSHVPKGADCAIVIQGDSMEPLLKNGGIVFYKRQEDVESGEIAIVEIGKEGVTCKKVLKDYENKTITLRSINAKYDDRIVKNEDIRIIGKVIT